MIQDDISLSSHRKTYPSVDRPLTRHDGPGLADEGQRSWHHCFRCNLSVDTVKSLSLHLIDHICLTGLSVFVSERVQR